MNEASSKSQSMASRIAYSFGAFGHDMFYGMLSTYFMMFVTGHLFNSNSGGQAAHMVSFITITIMVLRIVELVIDPFIGNVIDKTDTKWGHFKPWVVAGGIVSAVAIALLFTNLWGLTYKNPVLYLVVFAILYITMDIFYSFNDVAFWSMIPAISFDSAEREKTATFARVGSTLGGQLVGVVVMPIVLAFSISSNGGSGDSRGWFAFAAIVAAISAITSCGVGLFTHEKKNELRENKENTTFKKVFGVLLHNDQLMAIAVTYLVYTTGIQIVNSFQLYYFTYILGRASTYTLYALINGVIGAVTVALFPALAKKFSRMKVFYYSILVLLIGLAIFAFAGQSLPMVILGGAIYMLPQPLIFMVVLMIITDSVEYGQLKLGHRDEAVTLSVRPLLDKFGGAVAGGVVGMTATAAGMISGATASDITAHGAGIFKLMMFVVPAILILLGVLCFKSKVKLDEKMHAQIVDELEQSWHQHLEGNDSVREELAEDASLAKDLVIDFKAPVSGTLMPLSQVGSKPFADGTMGLGIAIKPSDGQVFAPFSGTVVADFPTTRHAIGLETDNGVPVLIHVGVDTVQMRGTGFINYVVKGQHVAAGEKLMEFWAPAIKKAGHDDTVMIAFTKSEKAPDYILTYVKQDGEVKVGDTIMQIEVKKD